MKAILINGDEQDALTPWRQYRYWHTGTRKRIKKRFNRRERHRAKFDMQREPLTAVQA